MTCPSTIWINAGETSGDLHGQLLARALKKQCPQARFVGMAGPAMRTEGVEAILRTEDLSVMGFTEVLGHLPKIVRLLRALSSALRAVRPDVIVVIDAPDFHFRVIRIAKNLGIPVVYYISPKLWAWRESRTSFLRDHVHRLVSILPFEKDFYARHGMTINYVGHPLLDTVRTPETLAITTLPNRVGILPGSRKKEITSLLPLFARTAELLAGRFQGLEFVLPIAPGIDQKFLRRFWTSALPVTLLESDNRYAVMRSCRAILAASGTVTLETALLGVPTAVAYTFSPLTFLLGKWLVKVPFISLPNLILNKEVFPEFLQDAAHPAAMAAAVAQWIPESNSRAALCATLATLPDLLGGGNAIDRAATVVRSVGGRRP